MDFTLDISSVMFHASQQGGRHGLNDTGQSALACLMLQECQEECWKALCAQLEHKLGCSIRHIASSNSSTYPDLMDEEEEEVVKRLDSEALREGLREVLSSMQRDLPNSRPVTLLERRMVTSRKSSDNSLLSL
ncbi:hypothetical protein AK812_SmicGene19998 [Symbiodinium microadriaticum]|uniref:Uncharacterized protein n=1 Tax=Symbiodinium microadriaticum TaxID=2951 RepID=A0A1Q9DR53_SYMMI|nr:hypothetical protein AK812_SmicGene19998 [Symbiodinium microadriaticum]